jgi:hypothetical protein
VAIIARGDTHSVIEKLAFKLSALPSCDPNLNSNCDIFQGNLAPVTTWGQDPLNYFWECFDVNDSPCPDSPELLYNKRELVFPPNYLDASKGPYKMTLRVETQTLPTISSATKVADILVLFNPTGVVCPRPDVSIASMPPRLNAHQGGVSLRGSVALGGTGILPEAIKYRWFVVDTVSEGFF